MAAAHTGTHTHLATAWPRWNSPVASGCLLLHPMSTDYYPPTPCSHPTELLVPTAMSGNKLHEGSFSPEHTGFRLETSLPAREVPNLAREVPDLARQVTGGRCSCSDLLPAAPPTCMSHILALPPRKPASQGPGLLQGETPARENVLFPRKVSRDTAFQLPAPPSSPLSQQSPGWGPDML